MDRRQFLKTSLAGAAGLTMSSSILRALLADPVTTVGDGPYGPLLPPDANGLRLPDGFTSRVIARSEEMVEGTNYLWHHAPDGGAVFPTGDGGWVYVSNSEVPANFGGGAGAVKFDASGNVVDAYRILGGTSMNCAGGAVAGKWYSCEEHEAGMVWECDPAGLGPGTPHPELGTFSHEAVARDDSGNLYLTEDQTDGRFYRWNADTGLAAAEWRADGTVAWHKVPYPNIVGGAARTRHQVPESTAFNGGEGCWFHAGFVYLTTKGDNRVWSYDTTTSTLEVIYDDDWFGAAAPLRGVDNVTVHPQTGRVLVAEDGDDLQICILADGEVAPLVQVVGHEGSEVAGPAFTPDGTRLYFSSQRGPRRFTSAAYEKDPTRPGVTFEVTGPF